MNQADVIIIGAGAAGLAAGAALAEAGKSIVILEARGRIGGRVQTVRDPQWPVPMEFGAEFIHGRPKESWELVHRGGLRAYDVTNDHWQSRGGKPVTHSGGWSGLDAVMQRLDRLGNRDLSFVDFLQQECADLPDAAKRMARAFVEGLDAADAKLVSARSIAASELDGETFDADVPFRIFDGYDRLLEVLARPVPSTAVQLNAVVCAVQWSAAGVVVETTVGTRFRAAQLIITLPIGVLRAKSGETGAVSFDPPLPDGFRDALDHMRMGPVVKVLLRFHRVFWEDGPWRDLGFVHSPGDVFPTWWTMLPCRVPLLTAWAGGPAAGPLSHQPAAQVLDAALHSLAGLLGATVWMLRTELAAWHVSDWHTDPYARGAYAFATVGGTDAAQRMAEPIEEKLYFAGEATHPGYAGTVAAAIASGHRAAAQTLETSQPATPVEENE
jgi:monoamine oxidase